MPDFIKGHIPWNKGLKGYKTKPASDERKRKIGLANSIALKGRFLGEYSPHWKGGKPNFLKCCKKLSSYKYKYCGKHNFIKSRGKNHYRWTINRETVKYDRRNDPEYKQWRIAIYKRDLYKCKINNSCNGRIEAHHILSWANYPELRYEVNNGITLCQAHHPKKRAEEKLLAPTFQELISQMN